MPLTNVLLAQSFVSLADTSTCGLSAIVSAALGSPAAGGGTGGRVTICVTNPNANAPIHVEARTLFTDANGDQRSATYALALSDATSALIARSLLFVASGLNRAFTVEGVVGDVFQVAVMKASNTATVMSSMVTMWAT